MKVYLLVILILFSICSQAQPVRQPKAGDTTVPIYKPAIFKEDQPIETIYYQTGFLKLTNKTISGKYRFEDFYEGIYQYYGDRVINTKNVDERIVLPVGKYRLFYNDDKKLLSEFNIVSGMVTEICF